MIASLANPLFMLVAFGFGFGPIFERAGGGDYINFLTPGIISQTLLFTGIFTGIELIWDRQFGFLKETFVAPVSRWQIIIGRTLGGATIAVFQGLLILLITLFIGFNPVSYFAILPALLIMLLTASLFAGLGTAIATMLDDHQGFQLVMNFLILPMFFLSGALFPLDDLPGFIKVISYINPMTYGVDALRYVLIGQSHFSIMLSVPILLTLSFATVSVGSYLFTKIEVK